MSHVVKKKTAIKDLDMLAQACQHLGLQLNLNQQTYRWYGRNVGDYNAEDAAVRQGVSPDQLGKCRHAISIPGDSQSYEIGLVPDGEGWALVYDFWAGGKGMMEKVGENCGKLLQTYGVLAAKQAMTKLQNKGFRLIGVKQGASTQLIYERR